MVLKKLIPAAATALLLVGCQSAKEPEAGLYGGVIATQYGEGTAKLNATGVGALLGAFLGKEFSSPLDKGDQEQAEQAAQRSYVMALGDTLSWSNPQNGHSGTIVSTRQGYNTAGFWCREFQQTVSVGARTEMAYGTACKQGDGTWKITK